MKTVIIIILLFFLPFSGFSQQSGYKWQIGEELTYGVTWTFIRLGTIKIKIYDSVRDNGSTIYKTKLIIESNPYLFFIDMHGVYETNIDNRLRPVSYKVEEVLDEKQYEGQYKFNYQDSLVSINFREVGDSTIVFEEQKPLRQIVYDGISMIFYARANIHRKGQDTLVSFIKDQKGKVLLNFSGKKEKIEIDAISGEQDVYYLDGHIYIKGIAGVTGPYKGWFAADNRRPPLRAELDIFLGSVVVELENWKNWNPQNSP